VINLHDMFGDGLVPLIRTPQNGTTVTGWTYVNVDLAFWQRARPDGVDLISSTAGLDVCLELDAARVGCENLGVLATGAPKRGLYLSGLTPRTSPFKLKAHLLNASTGRTVGWSSVMFFVEPNSAESSQEDAPTCLPLRSD